MKIDNTILQCNLNPAEANNPEVAAAKTFERASGGSGGASTPIIRDRFEGDDPAMRLRSLVRSGSVDVRSVPTVLLMTTNERVSAGLQGGTLASAERHAVSAMQQYDASMRQISDAMSRLTDQTSQPAATPSGSATPTSPTPQAQPASPKGQ